MRTLVPLCLLLVVYSTAVSAAAPDATALELTTKYGWGELPAERKSAIEYLTREKLVSEARMASPKNFAGPIGKGGAIVLQERLRMPVTDPTGQNVDRFTLIKKLELPRVGTTASRETLDNEQVAFRQLSFGETLDRVGEAFALGGRSIAYFGAALDGQIAKSAFGGDPHFDGAVGAAALQWMLDGETIYENEDTPIGEGCDVLASEAVDYSQTAAVGINPFTKRYSASMFLSGGACMFYEIGGRMQASVPKTEAELDAERRYEEMSRAMTSVGNSLSDSLVFHGFEGPPNDRIAVIGISDLDIEETLPDGSKVTIDEMRKGIDADAYVPSYLAYFGRLQRGNKTTAVNWRTTWDDYQGVPDTGLYEPRRQVLAMGGMLSDTDRKKMADAEKEIAKFEQQLASMPANQRAMMERMIGPQIEQFRKMAKGGGVEFEIITTAIEVNPNLVDPNNSLAKLNGEDERELLVKQIQKDLAALGYDPGPMSGELTPQTVSAIERFESDHGMPMTGEATIELANVLAISVLAAG